jgi:hypothetical protein
VTAKPKSVKLYVVRLSPEERERLTTLISAGKHPARQLTKARILLKADVSEAGEGWSDSKIAEALDTSIDTVARTRQQLTVRIRRDPGCGGCGSGRSPTRRRPWPGRLHSAAWRCAAAGRSRPSAPHTPSIRRDTHVQRPDPQPTSRRPIRPAPAGASRWSAAAPRNWRRDRPQ